MTRRKFHLRRADGGTAQFPYLRTKNFALALPRVLGGVVALVRHLELLELCC